MNDPNPKVEFVNRSHATGLSLKKNRKSEKRNQRFSTNQTMHSYILDILPKISKISVSDARIVRISVHFLLIICDAFVMRCGIWYHLYNLENVKNLYGGVLILAYNFTKINTPPWVFLTFFKWYKWQQIAQRITYITLGYSSDGMVDLFTQYPHLFEI